VGTTLIRDLNDNWRVWLAQHGIDDLSQFDGDLPVWSYEDDGAEEWASEPHLAVNLGRELVCPVNLTGWVDVSEVGWDKVEELAGSLRA
jgi:hypothetical protein